MPKQYDQYQLEAIGLKGGHHLVLAPPGCGKTDILAERIVRAREQGVAYADMLCLTFTNRAAKGMVERIEERTANPVPQQLFVGNVHRYCSQLLFENGVVPQGSAIIDDVDMDNIIRDELNRTPDIRVSPLDIFKLQHTLCGLSMGHRGESVLHNYLLREPSLRRLCTAAGLPFSEQSVGYVYTHIDAVAQQVADRTTMAFARRVMVARRYQLYKEENDIIDFDDLLMLTYDYAIRHRDSLRKYAWIQVDEVQDLNSLQLTIIDLISTPDATVVYLGDEQQAIYSFIGAKIETLRQLRATCGNNVHHLYHNYRSPRYLLDMLNDYATKQLGIRTDLLPTATGGEVKRAPEDLCLLDVGDATLEPYYIARFARRYAELGAERVAILVPTNKAADSVAEILESQKLDLFKISGTDLFSTPQVRLLMAHLTVATDESVFIAWARLLNLMGAISSYSRARDFMRNLKRYAIAPTDMLAPEWGIGSTYLSRFCQSYENEDLVIFDTETTGLDIYNDDIIQIAAIKVRRGKVLPGSRFNIIIETSRSIPTEVGGGVNPMLEVYTHAHRLSRSEGLALFAEYCKGFTLVGHNVEYDWQILRHNMLRSCPEINIEGLCPRRFDTLKLIRLLQPRLGHYKLGYLLDKLHLQGSNSHRADDDILATLELMNYCQRQTVAMLPLQEQFVAAPAVCRVAEKFRTRYAPLYWHTVEGQHAAPPPDGHPAIVQELEYTYRSLLERELIDPLAKWQHLVDYITLDLVDDRAYPTLGAQLARYITDLNTCKEADLCGRSLKERFLVSTVHKAKGLEFDTVIVTDAIDGTYPFARNWTEQQIAEDARRLYVALSRAKRHLCVVYSDYAGTTTHHLSPFLRKVEGHFSRFWRDPLTGKVRAKD